MSGHSKFANIKHKKEKNDAVKGKIFTRLGKEIYISVKMGGKDPQSNSRLRDAISKAKSNNMPNDNINRLIKKASGDIDSVDYEEITYEGYGPKGVAVIVKALTDNRNRAAANIRNAFTKGGGNMGTSGCVSFMFDEKGLIVIEIDSTTNIEELMFCAVECGADEFEIFDDYAEITTSVEKFSEVRDILENTYEILSQEVGLYPQSYVELNEEDDLKKFDKLITLLEEDDDVQDIYHNNK